MQEYNLEGGMFGRSVKKTPAPAPAPAPAPTPAPEVEEDINVTHGKLVELASLFETKYNDITDRTIFDLEPVTNFIFNNITPKLDNSIVGYSLKQSYTELLNEITEKLCKIKAAAAAAGEKIDFFSQGKSPFANTIQEEINNIKTMSSDVAIQKSLKDKEEKTSQAAMAELESRKQTAEADLVVKQTALDSAGDEAKEAAKTEFDAAQATLVKVQAQLESAQKEKAEAEAAEAARAAARAAAVPTMQRAFKKGIESAKDRSGAARGGGSRRNKNKKSKRGKKGKRIKRTRKN